MKEKETTNAKEKDKSTERKATMMRKIIIKKITRKSKIQRSINYDTEKGMGNTMR